MSAADKLQIALFQLPVSKDVKRNVENAAKAIKEVKYANPRLKLAILSETFNAPYDTDYFAEYSEQVPGGYTCGVLSKLAASLGIYIIGGSLIERAVDPNGGTKYYNTCTVWSPTGQLIGKHRKIHLFTMKIDIEHSGGVDFDEAKVLSPGNTITIVEIEGHKIGIGICHDKRFEELARIYRKNGCEMIVYPSAFCICQGPMHWELLQRSRASDNQLFVVTCSPARDNMSGYVAYGHSMIVNPWGVVQREAGLAREIVVEEIDFSMIQAVRRQIPLFSQRRTDIYDTTLVEG